MSIFFTGHLRLLLFTISNSNNLFKDFSAIPAEQIYDHLQVSQWQANLKMHSLITQLFPYSVFVKDLEQISY